MLFILTVFLVAFSLETYGSYISILGLAKNSSYMLIILAILLDISKIVIATILYKKWKGLHFLTKLYLVPGLLILMLFTSAGSYAYLMQEFSKTTLTQESISIELDLLKQEYKRLEQRKKEIDIQVSSVDPAMITQKRRLQQMFAPELEQINPRITALEKQIPELTKKSVESVSEGGTLGTIAKAYNIKPEDISKVLVFLLVLFIDPLAIILLTIGNYLLEERKKSKNEIIETVEKDISEDLSLIINESKLLLSTRLNNNLNIKLIEKKDELEKETINNNIINHVDPKLEKIDSNKVENKEKVEEIIDNNNIVDLIQKNEDNEDNVETLEDKKIKILSFPKKQAGKLSFQKQPIKFI